MSEKTRVLCEFILLGGNGFCINKLSWKELLKTSPQNSFFKSWRPRFHASPCSKSATFGWISATSCSRRKSGSS